MKETLDLLLEPKDDLYQDLIGYATRDCTTALLVVRDPSFLSPSGKNVLAQLETFLKEKKESSDWPGTILYDHTAWVFLYRFGQDSAAIFRSVAHALFDWQHPDLPEDLCLLRENKEPWLVSIAHERDAYFQLDQDEKVRLFKALPSLTNILRERSI